MRSFLSSSSSLLALALILFQFLALSSARPRPVSLLAGRDNPTQTTRYPIPAQAKISSFTQTATPCTGPTCVEATPVPALKRDPCDAANGTGFVNTNSTGSAKYILICDIDFPAQNIYPFLLAGSFDECLAQCESYNKRASSGERCAGFVFAPDRVHDADDCYLKSSLNDPISATIHLVGATIVSSTSTDASQSTSTSSPTPRVKKAESSREINVGTVRVLGTSTNKPTQQYVSHVPATPQKLSSNLLVPGLNIDLITRYPIAPDTGSWSESQLPSSVVLSNMKVVPHISRDGGKGGTINRTHLFIFCDTASFADEQGMVGFVSSSVATDDGMKALYGEPLDLVDNLGEWQDDVGRMRGFAPMTVGEESFNIDLSGNGYRYAVWPESSLIPLNGSHGLIYPALVYDVVDMKTQTAVFNKIGNSVLLVSVDPTYGPSAQRIIPQLFTQGQVAFGTLGGIRSWGVSGNGGNDGHVYLFGQGNNGVLVARTIPSGLIDLSTYEYWDGNDWTKAMPSPLSNGVILDIQVQDLDVVYVPALHSFLMIYLNTLADNTFYYRYLPLDLNADDKDFDVDDIVKSKWSDEKVLAKIDAPAQGYIYAGGMHAGYFGDDDITNGGYKILISWTEHTGKDAAAPESGYAHKTALVELNVS